jgi:peptidoglycan glycosyltransferase
VNRSIAHVFGLVLVLFALLVAFTSRWTVFSASSLRNNGLNARGLIEQERTPRGDILAADGSVLARSHRSAGGVYTRRYPSGSLFSDAIGYSFILPGQVGLERSENGYLTGTESRSGFTRILDQLQGIRPQGDTVQTTLDPRATRVATQALAGHRGAVVALDPRSGAVRVMVSTPGYNPNDVDSAKTLARLNAATNSPLVNRATQFGYAPGSTFKLVTATAAIDTGRFTADSVVDGKDGVVISGKPLHNDNDTNWGPITLTKALQQSVNTVWAQVAVSVGKATMARYMRRFGFDARPQLDYPAGQMSASGEYTTHGNLLTPTSDQVDVGRMGIGEDKLEVTPLQMAEVAATVANGGTLMRPYLVSRVVDSDGRTVKHVGPHVQSQVMKASTAAAVRTMMESVVSGGTGTAAQIPGITVAGKTGTAETQVGNRINNVWFVAFAPANAPRVAIAVTVQAVPGFGGGIAAPIAKQVMESLLGGTA